MAYLLLLFLVTTGLCLEFTPYQPSEKYTCGNFLQDRVEDKTLRVYYTLVNRFIDWISNPFPHTELLSNRALQGDWNEIRESLEEKSSKWFGWQQGWIIICGSMLVLAIVFPVLYLLYRMLACCCCPLNKKDTSDAKYDTCKRRVINLLLIFFVLVNVFTACTCLISSQYMQYGLKELPSRINQCVDDLNLYKRDTDLRIRKLLIDDYRMMNESIIDKLSGAGHNVIHRVKKLTGAQAIDTLLNISESAKEVKSVLSDIRAQVDSINEEATRFEVEFSRLRKTATQELIDCVQTEVDPVKTMCHKAERLLENLQSHQFKLDTDLIPESTESALQQIVDANISELLNGSNTQFNRIESQLQQEIDKKIFGAQNVLRRIGDDLFVVAETITAQIRTINFDGLYGAVGTLTDTKRSPAMKYINYSWYITLAIVSILMLISLFFFVGLLFGVCGKRPSFYKDDCCIKSTGSSSFSCGIWLTILMFTVLGVVAAGVTFLSSNSAYLVCQPLNDPLLRPDMMSFAERYFDIFKSHRTNTDELSKLLDSRTPADVIRACRRNETFYQIFEFDKKYHLNELKSFEKDAYSQLERFLTQSLNDMPEISPMSVIISDQDARTLEMIGEMNLTELSKEGLQRIQSAISDLDILTKVKSFQDNIDNSSGRPKVVSSILEQLEEVDVRIARPLRHKIDILHKNLSSLDTRLSDMQVPVSSLVSKLQHAQALLSEDIKNHFVTASKEELTSILAVIDQYIEHVKNKMQYEVSSCTPVAELGRMSTAALCSQMVDPWIGSSVAMFINLLCIIPIVLLASIQIPLYNKMQPFMKYSVDPTTDHRMSSFITDTYDTRQKPNRGYANYSYTDDYQRHYR